MAPMATMAMSQPVLRVLGGGFAPDTKGSDLVEVNFSPTPNQSTSPVNRPGSRQRGRGLTGRTTARAHGERLVIMSWIRPQPLPAQSRQLGRSHHAIRPEPSANTK